MAELKDSSIYSDSNQEKSICDSVPKIKSIDINGIHLFKKMTGEIVFRNDTETFTKDKQIGKGSYGSVVMYTSNLGNSIAVKITEDIDEVDIISYIQHNNIQCGLVEAKPFSEKAFTYTFFYSDSPNININADNFKLLTLFNIDDISFILMKDPYNRKLLEIKTRFVDSIEQVKVLMYIKQKFMEKVKEKSDRLVESKESEEGLYTELNQIIEVFRPEFKLNKDRVKLEENFYIVFPLMNGDLKQIQTQLYYLSDLEKFEMILYVATQIKCLFDLQCYYTDIKADNFLYFCNEENIMSITIADLGSIYIKGEDKYPVSTYPPPEAHSGLIKDKDLEKTIVWGLQVFLLSFYYTLNDITHVFFWRGFNKKNVDNFYETIPRFLKDIVSFTDYSSLEKFIIKIEGVIQPQSPTMRSQIRNLSPIQSPNRTQIRTRIRTP